MLRTAVSALLAAAVLVPASPAAAKELTTLSVCGAQGCVDRTGWIGGADRGHGGLLDVGRSAGDPRPEPFVRLRLGIGDGKEVFGRSVTILLPRQGVVRMEDGSWYVLPAQSLAFFRRASSGVPRVAASSLRSSLRTPERQAQVAETFAPSPAGDDGRVAPALLGGLAAMALAALAGGTFAWRRRHGGPERRPAIG